MMLAAENNYQTAENVLIKVSVDCADGSSSSGIYEYDQIHKAGHLLDKSISGGSASVVSKRERYISDTMSDGRYVCEQYDGADWTSYYEDSDITFSESMDALQQLIYGKMTDIAVTADDFKTDVNGVNAVSMSAEDENGNKAIIVISKEEVLQSVKIVEDDRTVCYEYTFNNAGMDVSAPESVINSIKSGADEITHE